MQSCSSTTSGRRTLALAITLVLLLIPTSAAAWIWDRDSDRIDDRIEATHLEGIAAAFERRDVANGRMIFAVANDGGLLRYGVYVGYVAQPTTADLQALRSSGVSTSVFYPFKTIPYVQMALTFPEIQKVASLPNVKRVEALEMVYPVNNNATKTSGATDSRFRRFPTVQGNLAITGKGVVISILDTGVNDEADSVSGFPGHEAFTGKFIAGGNFYSGQPELNTPADQSENPVDRGVDSVHGSHVAGTALGTGGPTRVFGGVAPDSMLVDQKVLSDAGAGFGSASGVEWAILNKDKYDIRVLNLSLGGLSNSDGTDAGSQAINAAFDAGIIALVATGNDEQIGYIASPSAADKAFSIGALEDKNSIGREDDLVASYSNEGPRLSDGDADFEDEMKPLISAPGSGIVSADGILVTDGRQYKPLSGTSMATPHVAGIVALMLEANPALTPQQVWDILKHTAEHRGDWGKTPAESRPFPQGDPNYHPSAGWGQVDAYAAVKEALRLKGDRASQTQVIFINAVPAADGSAAVDLSWKSQREINLAGYDIYRAEDVNGAPGSFVQINGSRLAGTGQAVIERVSNRNHYAFRDSGLQFGKIYWYRITHTSNDPAVGTVNEPAIAVTLGRPRPVARVQYSITHNDLDNDLLVLFGSGSQAERARIIFDGKSSSQADLVTTMPGEATTGNLKHDFTIDLTSLDAVEAFLPPSKENPWFLSVKEGGYVNRTGSVNSFSITMFDADGNPTQTYSTGDITPQRLVETTTTTLWIPDNPSQWLPGDSPSISEITPNAADPGASNVRVEIFGGEFTPGVNASFGAGITVHSTEYRSGSSLVATISIAADAAAGPRTVTVTNVDGKSGSRASGFTVLGETGGGCTPTTLTVGDSDPAVEYTGGWHLKEDATASAGTYSWKVMNKGTKEAPAARLVFTGNAVTIAYGTSTDGGSADVVVDGNVVRTISFAGSTKKPAFGSTVTIGDLTEGTHELKVVLRSGGGYIDGYTVAACQSPAANASASTTSSSTTTSRAELAALTGVLVKTVEVGAGTETLSVIVTSSSSPVTVNILNPLGTIVASGQALLAGSLLSGIDASSPAAGLYSVQVVNSSSSRQTVEVSIARTTRR
jgi:subtilisin family serine protease